MDSHWKVLPLSTKTNLGTLLFKIEVSSVSYDVYLTNLTDIWTESLDRKQIIKRALDQNTSIDPSEGPDQFTLLLDNIRGALEGRSSTNVSLSRQGKDSSFTLEVVAVLPEPLAQLKWPIRLKPASGDILTGTFILPCLRELRAAKFEIGLLLGYIKEKDKVISKLLDRFEMTGIEMHDVFPNVLPLKRSKGNNREHIISAVKGLKQFDERKWRSTLPELSEKDLEGLFQNLFESDAAAEVEAMHNNNSHSRESQIEPAESSSRSSSTDDDFQKQDTPTKDAQPSSEQTTENPLDRSDILQPKSHHQTANTAISTGSDTDDDLDLDNPTMRTQQSSTDIKHVQNIGTKKLGLLGGKKKAQENTISSHKTTGKPEANIEKHSPRESPEATTRVPQSAYIAKAKLKLGRIGGQQKVVISSSPTKSNAETSEPGVSPTTANNLFHSVNPERIGRESYRKSSSPPAAERETSQERADRKRLQLRRELEEKSRAPARKKRRF